jgi:hypothetical protein
MDGRADFFTRTLTRTKEEEAKKEREIQETREKKYRPYRGTGHMARYVRIRKSRRGTWRYTTEDWTGRCIQFRDPRTGELNSEFHFQHEQLCDVAGVAGVRSWVDGKLRTNIHHPDATLVKEFPEYEL